MSVKIAFTKSQLIKIRDSKVYPIKLNVQRNAINNKSKNSVSVSVELNEKEFANFKNISTHPHFITIHLSKFFQGGFFPLIPLIIAALGAAAGAIPSIVKGAAKVAIKAAPALIKKAAIGTVKSGISMGADAIINKIKEPKVQGSGMISHEKIKFQNRYNDVSQINRHMDTLKKIITLKKK